MSFNLNDSGRQKIAKALNKKGLRIVREAKQRCPVDTGRLRASITAELIRQGDKPRVLVGSNVSYAPHVEFGTENQAAQPFLRPAARSVLKEGPTKADFNFD
jgi:HK97 gp10 family phage protein